MNQYCLYLLTKNDSAYESYKDSDGEWKRRFEGYKFVHRMKIELSNDNELLGKVLIGSRIIRK